MPNVKMLPLVISSLFFASCGSSPTGKSQEPQSSKMVQHNFIVRERSHSEPPLWTYDFMAYNEQQEKSSDRFFVGDSGDVNDRMAGCESAKARARQEIAQEIGTFITSKMAETAEGATVINKMESNSSGGLNRNFASLLTSQAKSLLPGVQLVSSSWEERDYSQAGGANSVFNCKVLVKLSKKTLESVVKTTLNKVLEKESDSSKSQLLKTLVDAPKEFADQPSESN